MMVVHLEDHKKHPPNPQELATIEILRNIREKKTPTANDLSQITNKRMRETLQELASIAQDGDENDFWKAFDSLAPDNKSLLKYKSLILVPPGEAPEEKPDPRFLEKEGKILLKLSSINDIYALPDAEHLVLEVLEVGAVSLLYGISGTGKTFTSLNLGLTIAHGLPWHGKEVKKGAVWYINTEGGRGLKKRLKAWYIEHPDLEPPQNFHIIPWALDIREHYQILLNTLESLEEVPALIVIDNFSMCAPGVNQNNQEEVAPILAKINYIAQEYGCHIMVVHHTNKTGDVNGTMAFRNHVDTMIELKKEDPSNKNSPIIFSCQKARDDEPFGDIRTELKSITVYINEKTLRPITSCVVVDSDQPEPEQPTPEAQIHMLEILHAHMKLTCSQWQRYCEETHKISRPTFYRLRSVLEQDELITTPDGKSKGTYYILTEKGVKTIG